MQLRARPNIKRHSYSTTCVVELTKYVIRIQCIVCQKFQGHLKSNVFSHRDLLHQTGACPKRGQTRIIVSISLPEQKSKSVFACGSSYRFKGTLKLFFEVFSAFRLEHH